MRPNRAWLVGIILLISTPAWAQNFRKGTVEVGGITGFLLQRQTFEEADAADEGSTMSIITAGGDATYYLSPQLGLGLYLTRQGISFGPSTERFSISGTNIGPQVKFRKPLNEKVSVALAGAVGVSSTRTKFPGFEDDFEDEFDDAIPPTDEKTSGTFLLAGVTLNFFLSERISADAGIRFQRTSITSGEEGLESKMTVSGFLGGVGFSIFFNTGR